MFNAGCSFAPVAQLDRALASGAKGPAFESRQARDGRENPASLNGQRGQSFF